MIFEIVNHTYKYSRLLAYQLSLLAMNHKGQELVYSVFFDPADKSTVECIKYFREWMPKNVLLRSFEMEVGLLRNRAIGRNICAKTTKADWVWFTDTDYCFNDRCWEMLTEAVKDTSADLVWPGIIRETDWSTGQRLIESMKKWEVKPVYTENTVDKRMSRAIGGVQIARGSVVRETGYCPHYTGPSDDWNFRSDISFRRNFKRIKPISLWHAVRIRHEQKGYAQENRHEVVN